jgi:hypothetical protein
MAVVWFLTASLVCSDNRPCMVYVGMWSWNLISVRSSGWKCKLCIQGLMCLYSMVPIKHRKKFTIILCSKLWFQLLWRDHIMGRYTVKIQEVLFNHDDICTCLTCGVVWYCLWTTGWEVRTGGNSIHVSFSHYCDKNVHAIMGRRHLVW